VLYAIEVSYRKGEVKTVESIDDFSAQPLSPDDREMLESYKVIAEGIGRVFGDCCEVTLHSLEDPSSSVVSIVHGEITGRSVGSPLTDLALEILGRSRITNERVIGPYYSTTETGKRLRSVTMLIHGRSGALIGFLCVNLDLSAPLTQFMTALLPKEADLTHDAMSENYSRNVDDLVKGAFYKAMSRVSQATGVSPIEKNKQIIQELQEFGVFTIKGSVDTVAAELGVSKFTIYNYLRDIKGRISEMEKING
jgi:predicted transcriptional regulator YheO